MDITLSYGRDGLPVSLPDDWDVTVVRKPAMPILGDPAGAVEAALTEGVDARPLVEEAEGKKSACILICDVTRPVPNGLILPPVIKSLTEGGIPLDRITVLVATGLHRPNEGEELRELVGDDWVLGNVEVVNHFARNDEDHVFLGRTEAGQNIRLDKRFVEADLKIVTGLVEPHFMAGWSGGRKVITPGVCHAETITSIHTAEFFEHPQSANCVLKNNPLHEVQLEILAKVKPVLAVNTVLDEERRLGFVSYGDVESSHLKAIDFMAKYATVPFREKFNTVITTSAGFPLDQTYYQTVKGMVGAMEILAPGGKMFIASSCAEGMGSPEYVDAQKNLIAMGIDGFLQHILPKKAAAIDEWQTEMQLKPMRVGDILLYTERLSEADKALTGVEVIDDLTGRVKAWVEQCGDKKIAVVPEGPYVVPRFVID